VSAVVLGAGVDALVAARLLSRSHSVTVLHEENPAEERGWLPPQVRELLGKNALEEENPDPWAMAPLPQGGRLELWRDMGRSVESIRRVSERDAARWPEFCARMARLARFLERIYLEAPPDPLGVRFAVRARLLGKQGLVDLMRLLPMPVAELLDDWFENDALKGTLGAAGVMGLRQGPRSGGTAFVFLHHHVGSPPGVFRPPRTTVAPETDVQKKKVQQILVNEGRARGVVLADGTEIAADLVISTIHPQRTLLELVDAVWLDPELVRAVRHIRSRAPAFATLVDAPSLDHLERAHDASKYGTDGITALPPQPVAELTLDQALWMRPVPELAHYRAPIEGLWLAGPSMHPGPGILGASGYNAARAILGKRK
jgi:phytoene dehydrogenase-like protein